MAHAPAIDRFEVKRRSDWAWLPATTDAAA
jgi:hypothetical protein